MSEGYDRTLALIHAWVVRTGIKAGMMALPSREHFFTSIGETGESAAAVAAAASCGWGCGWGCGWEVLASPAPALLRCAPPHASVRPLVPAARPRAAEESARSHAEGFVVAARQLVGQASCGGRRSSGSRLAGLAA